MPADTRSNRKAKHNDGGKQKEKCYPSEDGLENASGIKSSIREQASRKNCSISPLSMPSCVRPKNGNLQTQEASPLRKSERARSISNSGKSDTSMSLTDATRKSLKRKKSVNGLVIEDRHGKRESNASSQGKKTLCARSYRELFRAQTKKFEASDSANERRVGPCTSSDSGGCREKIPVADKDDLNKQGICGEAFAESTSKSDKEMASETPNVLSLLDHNNDSCDVEGCQGDPESITLLKKKFSPSIECGPKSGPCTSSNGGGCREKIPVADEDDLKEQGICGEAFAESTSKSDKVVLENVLQKAASETPDVLSLLDHNNDSCDVEGRQADPGKLSPFIECGPASGPCTSSNGGGCSEKIPVADGDDFLQQGIHGEAFVEGTSKSDKVVLENVLQEAASETPNVLSDHNNGLFDVKDHQVDPGSITPLRENLSPFNESGPLKLVEYWVPVHMSNLQLELYCSSLLTNSIVLRSKSDPVGLLRELLVSTRKCCDHPYLVDEKLRAKLTQGSPPADTLDIEVEASGKLYFLDSILTKIKDQGKKVIILFKKPSDSGQDIIGNILDDYVCGRFGEHCYERVDALVQSSRRQTSVARFNKEGRFIFLLETRACSPSIKLSSIDAVIIFGSDWNPLNDLKALQKIKIDSESELKVFRLYTLCSIEEKVLLLSKKSIFLESKLKGPGFSTSHMLLSWGASFLFKKLDEFHDCPGDPKILPRCSLLKDVGQEFLSVLQAHGTHLSTKCISNARHNDRGYYTDIPLLGEWYNEFKDEDQHRLLWTKLLEGRQPTWIYLSLSSQRIRKRVQLHGETLETNAHINNTVKRHKKNENTSLEPCSPRVVKDVEKEPVSGSYGISATNEPELSPNSGCSPASAQKINAANLSDKLFAEQKDLHQMLKPDMERLFQILNLKEDVKQKAEQFLLYIIANQRVIREPDQLQAFLISVCWVAASILKQNQDHVESLSLAREHLNFNCKIDDAEFAFSKMQFTKKMFLRSEGAKPQGVSKDLAAGTQGPNVSDHKQKYINKIARSVLKLLNRQKSEEKELKNWWHESKGKLEKYFKLESAVICSINSTEAVRIDKLKILEANHKKKLEKLDSEMSSRVNSMKAKHEAEKKAKEKEGIRKMNELKSWEENWLLDNLPAKVTEGIPSKSFSLSGNDLKQGNSKEHGLFENSSTAEGAANCGDRGMDINRENAEINNEARLFEYFGETALDSLDVQRTQSPLAVAAEEIEQIATSKNDPLSAGNPNLQQVGDANKEARIEQHDEASSSTHHEFMNSPSAALPVVSQEHETSSGRLNNEDVYPETSRDVVMASDHSDGVPCNTSEQTVCIHLPPDSTSPVDAAAAVSHPAELTPPDSTIPCTTLEAPTQEDHRPLNSPVEGSPQPLLDANSPSQNSNHFQSYMPRRPFSTTLPPSQVFDPLQDEYERVCVESNQVTLLNKNKVVLLKSECEKEIEELVSQIQRKYESMVNEAEASFLEKKRELEHIQMKVAMNIRLAEAFRGKCIDQTKQGSNNAATRTAAASPLPRLPEVARHFEAWNLTEFEGYLDERGRHGNRTMLS